MRGEMTPGVTMMDALDSEPPTAGDTSRWQAVTATERGAAHRAAGLPNQDAVEVRPLDGGMVAAVADGHGHARHFRSARGARLAVSIACQAAADLATRPGGLPALPDDLRHLLVPDIVTQWRDAVHRDVTAEPFTRAEESVRRSDDVTIPYGTTLLVAIGAGERLLLAQIGDGDIVCIRPDGTALLAVPGGRPDEHGRARGTAGHGRVRQRPGGPGVGGRGERGTRRAHHDPAAVLDGKSVASAGGPVRLGRWQCRRHHPRAAGRPRRRA